MTRRLVPVLLALAALLAAGGCGFGPGAGDPGGPVELTVTRDFGARVLLERTVPDVPESETVLRLLQRSADVETRFGGGFVQCVDGLCGSSDQVDWFYFVNGVEADKGAAAVRPQGGDRVWWDRRDWSAAQRVPAVVGSYPQPFAAGGYEGARRLPVRVECAEPESAPCEAVQERLVGEDVAAVKSTLRNALALETLRILVGPWERLRVDATAALLEDGPATSGVFAEPRADGRTIALLGPDGRVRRTLGAGTGLVAATRGGESSPVWVVTGTDASGLGAAVAGLRAGVLRHRFAVAFPGTAPLALPLGAGEGR
ncbi:MAG: DUF4430 domain-containing protein [Solirubrobacteraceae bacterium]|nr:DUF4430 domain-containing protein [Solirubrobacteraceae bacterium]